MSTKELLNKLDKELLVQFLSQYIADPLEVEELNKNNKKTLISKISKLELDDDTIMSTLGYIGVNVADYEDSEENSENSEENGKKISPRNDSHLKLRELIRDTIKKSDELVVISVSSNKPTDISLGKTSEVISVENMYYKKAILVPFNTPCEVPRCIYENLKQAKIAKFQQLSDQEQIRQGKTFQITMANHYNVVLIKDPHNGIGMQK